MEIRPKDVELGSKCGKVPWPCPWGLHTTGWHDGVCNKLINLINDLTKNKTPRELARLKEIYVVGYIYEYLSWRDMYYKMETWPIEDIFPKKFTTFHEE